MRTVSILIPLCLVWLLASCKARKEATSQTIIYKTQVDTIDRDIVRYKPIYNTIEILELCDSTTARPRPFFQTVENGGARAQISIDSNRLRMQIDIDSLERSVISRYKQSAEFKSLTDRRVEIREKTPPWAWWLLAAVTAYLGVRLKLWRYFI